MRRFILIVSLLTCIEGFSQADTNDFDHVFYTIESMDEFVFGGISDKYIETGFLLNKCPFISDEWKKFNVINGRVINSQKKENWSELYRFLLRSDWDYSHLPKIKSRTSKIIDNLFSQDPKADKIELPILCLDFNVNRIDDEAISNGQILFQDSQFQEGSNPEEGIDSKHLFFAGTFLDTLKFTSLVLNFDPFFIQSNREVEIVKIKIDLNGYIDELNPNERVSISNFLPGENEIEFEFVYEDGTIVKSSFVLYKEQTNRSGISITSDEEDFFDEVGTFGPAGAASQINPSLTYCIKWACNNQYERIRKPVIFVSGFNMAVDIAILTQLFQADCKDQYEKYNISGLVDNLRGTGHDIIMVRFIPAVADLRKNAQLLAELITYINTEKFNEGNYFENMLIGFSAGSMTIRYALDLMEHNHMENGDPHHHSKLYVSFEGEHNGAYIPLGPHAALTKFEEIYTTDQTLVIEHMSNSIMAQQLLKYYHEETGQLGTSYSEGQGESDLRKLFLGDMEDPSIGIQFPNGQFIGHSKQLEKHGYYGFPAFTRNVSIANGSFKTETANIPNVENSPYLFMPGHTMYTHETILNPWNNVYWEVNLGYNWQLSSQNYSFPVFTYQEFNIFGSLIYHETYRTDNTFPLWGKGTGGFLHDEEDLIKRAFDRINQFFVGGNNSYDYKMTCFTPTTSCHAIRNFDPTVGGANYSGLYPYQIIYDFQDQNLMYQDFLTNNPTQSNFYGYPAVGNPNNHFDITPFEAIYCDQWNQHHISSYNLTVGNPIDYPTIKEYDGHPHIESFIFGEMQPHNTYLQNQQIGWNTNGEVYKAEYEATNAIFVGEKVTPRTDVSPYEIWDNGDITLKAENFIHLTPGFHAQPGSEFHALINTVVYWSCPSGLMVQNDNGVNQNKNITFQENKWTGDNLEKDSIVTLEIYPNPVDRNFPFKINCPMEDFEVRIYSVSGEIVFFSNSRANADIYPNLSPGSYVVVVSQGSELKRKMLIVK